MNYWKKHVDWDARPIFFSPTAGPHFTDDVTLRLVSPREPDPVLPPDYIRTFFLGKPSV